MSKSGVPPLPQLLLRFSEMTLVTSLGIATAWSCPEGVDVHPPRAQIFANILEGGGLGRRGGGRRRRGRAALRQRGEPTPDKAAPRLGPASASRLPSRRQAEAGVGSCRPRSRGGRMNHGVEAGQASWASARLALTFLAVTSLAWRQPSYATPVRRRRPCPHYPRQAASLGNRRGPAPFGLDEASREKGKN
ncbi:hypothetical protein NL676_032729 [Syzygium grande]|nr:hypothetical protein NL676_032729 [Syzygium grande]